MVYIRDKLFYMWMLLIPFGHQLTAYTGLPSPDKILAPFLLLMGLFFLFQSSGRRFDHVISFMFLVLLLLLVKNISFIGNNEVYISLMQQDMVNFGYFFIPLLCITNLDIFRKAGWLVVFIAVVGCVSPFLVSLGLITLPIGWFEDSRIGGLLKTKGLFLSNGDLVQYITFATAWVILAPGVINIKSKSLKLIRYVLFISIFLGLLGTQSRNVLVSLIVGLFTLWWFVKSKELNSGQKLIAIFGFTFVSLVFVAYAIFFSAESYDAFVSAGGESARRTAETRLNQYAVAWDIILNYPLLGADLQTFTDKGHFIGYIHNIWFRMLAHGGLLTALVLLFLFIYTYKKIRGAARIVEKSDESLVVTAYFTSMLVALMFYVGLGLMFWAILGIAAALACIEPFTNKKNNDSGAGNKNENLANSKQTSVRTGVTLRS